MGHEYRQNYADLADGSVLVVDFTDSTTDYYSDAEYTLPPYARTVHVKLESASDKINLPNAGQMQGHHISIMVVSESAGGDALTITSDDAYHWSTDPGDITLSDVADRILLFCDGCVWYNVESAGI